MPLKKQKNGKSKSTTIKTSGKLGSSSYGGKKNGMHHARRSK